MKKIMFNDRFGLTADTLEGRKTVTRRIVNIKDCSESHKHYNGADWKDEPMQLIINKDKDGSGCYCYLCGNGVSPKNKYCGIPLPYQIGEVAAVAQRYKDIVDTLKEPCLTDAKCWMPNSAGWNNKMFVKAEFMPHQIEILDVRVERLQDITDEDCIKEGIIPVQTDDGVVYQWRETIGPRSAWIRTPKSAYACLIDSIDGKGTWDNNPYVFRYEFKLK